MADPKETIRDLISRLEDLLDEIDVFEREEYDSGFSDGNDSGYEEGFEAGANSCPECPEEE